MNMSLLLDSDTFWGETDAGVGVLGMMEAELYLNSFPSATDNIL